MTTQQREVLEKQLLARLNRLGILPETAVLDNVLDMSLEDILERRLQTLVFRKGMAKSIHQARQLITHGHVAISDRRALSPSYLVLRDEEANLTFAPTSPAANPEHPLRQMATAEPRATSRPARRREEGPEAE
jgi:small subunit ribosomal protein S4